MRMPSKRNGFSANYAVRNGEEEGERGMRKKKRRA
jgi:hypothetical protein